MEVPLSERQPFSFFGCAAPRRPSHVPPVATDANMGGSSDLSSSTALVLGLSLFCTPITTMSYNPVMPLFVVEELGVGMWELGTLYTVLTVASLFSYALMLPALRVLTIKQLLIVDYALRALSGIFYVLAVRQPPLSRKDTRLSGPPIVTRRLRLCLLSQTWHARRCSTLIWQVQQHGIWSMTLLHLSRGFHGISLNSPALPPIYVGLHVPYAQRPKAQRSSSKS
jgi:hypothetical protein